MSQWSLWAWQCVKVVSGKGNGNIYYLGKNDPADIHNDTIIIDESSEEEEESKNNISDCDSSIFNFIVNC